jgi:hypothetical protein
MKQFLICMLILCFAAPCLADQTIYCPQNRQELEKKCKEAIEKDRAITEHIQRWEPMVHDQNMMMYKIVQWKGESREQYLNRVRSMQTFYYQGLNYPVRGRFTKGDAAYIPLTYSESESVLRRAYQDPRQVKKQMDYVKQNTHTLKPEIRNKIESLKKEQQQHILFKAQCCGYRWTNEVGNQPQPQPQPGPKPGGTGKGRGLLLDVEVDK